MELPQSYDRPLMKSYSGSTYRFVLDKELTSGLEQVSSELGTTMFMNLFGIYKLFLSKLSHSEDIIVGTPVSGRSHADLEEVVGMFVNTLPIRSRLDMGVDVGSYLLSIKERVLTSLEHQFYQYESLVEALDLPRDTGRNPLFDVLFVYQQAEGVSSEISELELRSHDYGSRISKFDLTLFCVSEGDEIACSFEYCTDLFDVDLISRFSDYFTELVRGVLRGLDQVLGSVSLLDASSQELLLSGVSRGIEKEVSSLGVHELFERQAVLTPDAIALTYEGESMLYAELNARSNQLAHYLRGVGVGINGIVGIMQDRSFEMIVSLLGILKSGGAYLPIDPGYPMERISGMITDSGMEVLLTVSDKQTEELSSQVRCIALDKEEYLGESEENLSYEGDMEALLYVLYTSGSTGVPKGAMMSHGNLVNLLDYHLEELAIDSSSVLQFTTLTFDPSFMEIFTALLSGGTLHLISEELSRDFTKLLKHMGHCGVRSIYMPSSVLNQLFNAGLYQEYLPSCLTHIVTAGEEVVLGELFKSYLERTNVKLHNHYGPAETHVVTSGMVRGGNLPTRPNIGYPIQNTQVYILDGDLNPQPEGVVGELYAGGVQVGKGYLNNDTLTRDRFVSNPYGDGVLYRTGDLGRWLSDGAIEFLGRIDDQVKLNGVRIEPGEIMSHLNGLNGVVESAVLVREVRGEKSLVAYYVSEEVILSSAFREHLVERFPISMIPQYYVHMEAMPQTATGKLYKQGLPEPDLEGTSAYVAPSNEIETALVGIWSGVLGISEESIGVTHDFFELGGHSLKAITLGNRISRDFSVEVPLRELFVHRTIRELSSYIS